MANPAQGRTSGLLRPFVLTLVLLLGLHVGAHSVAGQCAQWLQGQSVPGVDGQVTALVELPGGDIVVGGAFFTAGPLNTRGIARFHTSTGTWSTLGGGLDGGVSALGLLPNGDLVAGGTFLSAGGVRASGIARYNPASDTWSSMGDLTGTSIYDVHVFALQVLPDGDVIAAGQFTGAGGVPANNIARFSVSTGQWSPLANGVSGFQPLTMVYALALLPDGNLIVGGTFSAAGDAPASNIARYDFGSGQWSSLGSGTDGGVSGLAVLPGGDVVVGGFFSFAGGVLCNTIARYNVASSTWSPLAPGGGAYDAPLLVLPDGDLLVGGFQSPARYHVTTGTWSILGGGVDERVLAFMLRSDGTLILGGLFYTAGNVGVAGIAAYDMASDRYSALSTGTNSSIFTQSLLPDGTVLMGGPFTAIGDISAMHVARYDPANNTWTPLGAGTDDSVFSLVQTHQGDVIAGGYFTHAGGTPANMIARFNPVTGEWSALGRGVGGVSPLVTSILVLPNDDLIVGGRFSSAGGLPANNIARYHADTGAWSPLGAGVLGDTYAYVSSLGLDDHGDLIVGGSFSTAGGLSLSGIARYDLSTNTWSSLSDGSGAINTLVVLPGGDLIVGGQISIPGTSANTNIARLSASTGIWSPLGSGVNGSPQAIALLPGGDLVVGGRNIAVGNTPAGQLAWYHAASDSWSPLGAGVDSFGISYLSEVHSLSVAPGGDVLVGGYFSRAGGNVSPYFARLTLGDFEPVLPISYQIEFECVPDTAEFSVHPIGVGPFTYQWQIYVAPDGWMDLASQPRSIPCPRGGTGLAFAFPDNAPDVQIGVRNCSPPRSDVDEWVVRCVVSNACGSAATEGATLLVANACGPTCMADFAYDGVLDQHDVDALIDLIAGGPNPSNIDTDFNHDGIADQGDVDALIRVIAGGPCP